MKRRFLATILAVVLFLSHFITFAPNMTANAKVPEDAVHISDLETLFSKLSSKEKAYIILDKDLEYINRLGHPEEKTPRYVNGIKTLDLNGHRLSFKINNNDVRHGGPNTKTDSPLFEFQQSFEKNSEANTFVAFIINSGCTLTVCDTSKKQEGQLISHAYIARGTHHYTEYHEIIENSATCVDAFHVKDGGKLILSSGEIVAGRSKKYWLSSARKITDTSDCYTGNGRLEVGGTGVLVEKGGSFDCFGGRVAGRGYEKVYMLIRFCELNGFLGEPADNIIDAKIGDNCAAVRVLAGGTANLYDGEFSGKSGANALDAKKDSNVKVYSGYFDVTRQEHSIIAGDLDHNMRFETNKGILYSQEMFYDTGYGSTGLTRSVFPYGDDKVAIYEGKSKKESKRVYLELEKTGEKTTGTKSEGVSAGITLVSGSSKVNINRENSPLDGLSHSYTVCPASAQVYNFTDVKNAVSYTESKMEYAKDTHCILTADASKYFPADDPNKSAEHNIGKIEWQLTTKNPNGKSRVTPWGGIPGVSADGKTVDLYETLKDAKVGDVYTVRARFTETWSSKHDYKSEIALVTPEITVVTHDRLCEHNYNLVLDTATCTASGTKTYVCKKCGDKYEEESKATGKHQYVRTYNNKECWDVCEKCGNTANKHAHNIESRFVENVGATLEKYENKCKDCGYAYFENRPSACKHEFIEDYCFCDEEYHWAYCKKCGECVKEKHHLVESVLSDVARCEGISSGNGNTIKCSYYWIKNANQSYGLFHETIGGEFVTIPTVFCAHTPLTIDYSHLSDAHRKMEKTITWTLNWKDNDPEYVKGTETLNVNDYLKHHTNDEIETITVAVVVDKKVFTATSVLPLCTEIQGYAASCAKTGLKHHWVCPGCGKTVDSKAQNSKVINAVIPATGKHVYDDVCDTTCNTCGLVREAPHDWETTKDSKGNTVPLYRYDGITYHSQKCKKCGATRDFHEHEWDEKVIKKADCTTGGECKLTCKVCGESLTGTYPVKGGHDYEIVSETPESCQKEGSVTYKCKVCGDTHTDVIPKLQHIIMAVEGTKSTCIEQGTAAHYKCMVCGEIFADEFGTTLANKEALTLPLDPNNHVVTGDYEYSFNETHHWCACECGKVIVSEEHHFDENGECRECEYAPKEYNVLPKAAEEAGFKIVWIETPEVGNEAPPEYESHGDNGGEDKPDPTPGNPTPQNSENPSDPTETPPSPKDKDKKGILSYWWIFLIILILLALIAIVIILLCKLKKEKNEKNEKDNK